MAAEEAKIYVNVQPKLQNVVGDKMTFEEYQKTLGDAFIMKGIANVQRRLIRAVRKDPEYAKTFKLPLVYKAPASSEMDMAGNYAPEFSDLMPAKLLKKVPRHLKWFNLDEAQKEAIGKSHPLSSYSRIDLINYLNVLVTVSYPWVIAELAERKRRRLSKRFEAQFKR